MRRQAARCEASGREGPAHRERGVRPQQQQLRGVPQRLCVAGLFAGCAASSQFGFGLG